MDSAESLSFTPPLQLILLSSLTQMSLCNRWHKNLKWHRGDATKVTHKTLQRVRARWKKGNSTPETRIRLRVWDFFFCFGLFSAETMILWLSYGCKTFHAPLSALARTHPNKIIGNEICLDEGPGLHSPCHDSGILMSCWNRYMVRTWPKRKTVFRGCLESKSSQHLLPDMAMS